MDYTLCRKNGECGNDPDRGAKEFRDRVTLVDRWRPHRVARVPTVLTHLPVPAGVLVEIGAQFVANERTQASKDVGAHEQVRALAVGRAVHAVVDCVLLESRHVRAVSKVPLGVLHDEAMRLNLLNDAQTRLHHRIACLEVARASPCLGDGKLLTRRAGPDDVEAAFGKYERSHVGTDGWVVARADVNGGTFHAKFRACFCERLSSAAKLKYPKLAHDTQHTVGKKVTLQTFTSLYPVKQCSLLCWCVRCSCSCLR
jgi:hypothetical protein